MPAETGQQQFPHPAVIQHDGSQGSPFRTDANECRESKLGRQVAVDLQANADLDKCRSCPGHLVFLGFVRPLYLNGLRRWRKQPPIGVISVFNVLQGRLTTVRYSCDATNIS